MRLREDLLVLPDGSTAAYAYVERPRFAIVAAIEDGRVWMVEQYRHPLRTRTLELPMGVAPGGDAVPIEEAARIELREETGLTALELVHIGEITPAPALIAQSGALYLATGLTEGPQDLEPMEQGLEARPLAVDHVLSMILSGEIRDAVTIAAFGLLRLRAII
ncbi:MAG: NUDIX hydrolase [Rhodobacteraceae bacterium]|nr:MAG: NUDIX hydrolase [Paracoccaceae bacterium]